MLSLEDHNSDTCRLISLIRALYTKLNKVLSLTPDRALYQCKDLLHIISQTRLALPLLYSPDHLHNTLCICCLSCSCP